MRGQEVALGFTSGGTCRFAKPSRNERSQIRRFEAMLKEERIIAEDKFVMHVMEVDSFNDTIREVKAVLDLDYPHDQQMIAVNSIDMYTAIDEYRRGISMESATVNTKYKMVDKKIKLVAIPLPEDSWQRMKEVAKDPSLRDPKKIGHNFTKETKEKVGVGKENFLLPEEERAFRRMLEHHGKAFAFSPHEIGCADPK
jgi:hypothetical protein